VLRHFDGRWIVLNDVLYSMPRKIAQVVCPGCQKTVVAIRGMKGRIIVTTGGGLLVAAAGAFVGAGIGLAAGGGAMPATVPLAAGGAVVGMGCGYIIADKLIDKRRCPSCDAVIDLGI
jgi:hypothetical protein